MLPEPVTRLPGTQGAQGPQLAVARDGQPVTERPGKDQEMSGTPQITWGGRMMEDATNGEGMSYGW